LANKLTPLRQPACSLPVAATTVIVGCSAALSYGDIAAQFYATLLIAILGVALTLWCALDHAFDRTTLPTLLVALILTRVVALFAQPLLEDDHFRYLWDGYITATSGTPYSYAPEYFFGDTHLTAALQDTLSSINNPEIPTIYGPALQVLFALCYWVAPLQLWPFKVMLLIAEIAVVVLLWRARVSPRWLLVFILHPLVIKESAITAHPDLLIGASLLAATLAWRKGGEVGAAALVAIALAMKFSVLVAMPFFLFKRDGRFSARAAISMIAVLAICYAPFVLLSGSAEIQALAAFGQHWTFNPLLFRWVAAVVGDVNARATVAVLLVIIWALVAWHWFVSLRRGAADNEASLPPVTQVTTVLLLLAPAVNPWYWFWILPLAMLHVNSATSFTRIAFVAASVSLMAYSHVGLQVAAHSSVATYAVPWWSTVAQLIAIASITITVFWNRQQAHQRLPKRNDEE
jgi:alpha-1,6-mannosyltransferase